MSDRETKFEVSPPTSNAVPDVGRLSFLLVPSFLLGPECWRGVSEVLGRLGHDSVIAAPSPTTPNDADHIGPWVEQVVAAVDPRGTEPLVVVAHSMSCSRLPLIAKALIDRGRVVHALVSVNGKVPWIDGQSPVDADPQLRQLLDGLVRPNDYLPPWHRWWGSMILDMVPDEAVRERVFAEARAMPRALFDQPIPIPALPQTVRRTFLATGRMYEPAYDKAKAEGWTVARLDGEHLHIVVDPVSVAGALLSLVGDCRGEPRGQDAAD